MKESFLHYIWSTRQYAAEGLKTTDDEYLVIHKQGTAHQDGGPDFKNGLVQIDEELWAGNIEIHIKSSDWFAHNHQQDPTYDSTILHVVFSHDKDVRRSNGTLIPCLELQERINPALINQFNSLINNSHKIPCEQLIDRVKPSTKILCVEAMAIKRLEEKSEPIYAKLSVTNNNWEEVLYQEICSSFGMRVNKLPFGLLAKTVPFKLVQQYRNDVFKVESLYYGSAGFLFGTHKDPYFKKLKQEFAFLQQKHSIQILDLSLWKFLRLRPSNFPTIRISQLANLVCSSKVYLSQIKSDLEYTAIVGLLKVEPSTFWLNHYTFDKKSSLRKKVLGVTTIHTIVINAIIPVLYCYAKEHNDIELQEQCMSLMEELPPELNSITKYFKTLDFSIDNGLQSQGLLQLHNKSCIFKACLDCPIGHDILKKTQYETTIY